MVLTRVLVAAPLPWVGGVPIRQMGWLQLRASPKQCRSVVLVVHRELRVLPLKVQGLSYQDVLIVFDSGINMEWVAQKLFRMKWCMGAPCHLECIPCSNWGGGWVPPGSHRIDWPIKEGAGNPHRSCRVVPYQKFCSSQVSRCHPEWPEHHSIRGFQDTLPGHI